MLRIDSHLPRRAPLFALITLTIASGCTTETAPDAPAGPDPALATVVESGPDVDVVIGDEGNQFRVVNHDNLSLISGLLSVQDALDDDSGLIPEDVRSRVPVPRPGARRPAGDSLVVGYPIRLLGQGSLFGGVITRVSDPDDEFYGSLKLIQLPGMHVRPYIAPLEGGGYGLALIGCESGCSETSPRTALLTIPILGVDGRRREVLLDLATLGEGLGLDRVFPPYYAGLEEVATRATAVDYSTSTLVFDVESTLVPLEAASASGDSAAEPLYMTTRWYLALGSRFESAFTVRDPIDEVGFFTTDSDATPRISRFATTRHGGRAPVVYYIKNVPEIYRDAFSAAFDDWNAIFRDVLGYDLIEYHHIGVDHPLNPYLVTGDVRFNIVEWDIDNLAFYGGLGPSIAHGFTGEVISGMVLIQGPDIVRLYREWFGVADQVAAARDAGDLAGAERLLAGFHHQLQERKRPPALGSASARLGALALRIPAQEPAFHDPAVAAFDFDELPTNADFDSYMPGYFRTLVAHEIGHNLGLYHNFMGSLSGDGDQVATHSIMEYAVRHERHIAGLGEYDRQAIAYGYAGVVPEQSMPYCNDVEVPFVFAPSLSAECSPGDAGPDSFGYFRDARVQRAVDLVIGRGLGAAAPEWTPEDVYWPLQAGLEGMAYYATSAEATSHTWQNFFDDPIRPGQPEAIRDHVVGEIQGTICSPSIAAEIEAKHAASAEAGRQARDNWLAVLDQASFLGDLLGLPIGYCELVDSLSF